MSIGDNLHEMSNLYSGKNKKFFATGFLLTNLLRVLSVKEKAYNFKVLLKIKVVSLVKYGGKSTKGIQCIIRLFIISYHSLRCLFYASRKHAYIMLTPLNPTFI